MKIILFSAILIILVSCEKEEPINLSGSTFTNGNKEMDFYCDSVTVTTVNKGIIFVNKGVYSVNARHLSIKFNKIPIRDLTGWIESESSIIIDDKQYIKK